ncbi:MAG: hypothetical protein WCB61_24910, partial [Pseudolabrys sp.]
ALISITFGTIYQKRFGGGIDWRPGRTEQMNTALRNRCCVLNKHDLAPSTKNAYFCNRYLPGDHTEATQ